MSIDLDESEIFNAYNEIPSISDKDDFLIPFIEVIMDPNFHTGTTETDQTLLKSLIVFACLMEGLFFYVGFTQINALFRKAVDLEYAYAEDTMPRGVLGMNASMFKGYLRFIANRRAVQIGLEELFPGEEILSPG